VLLYRVVVVVTVKFTVTVVPPPVPEQVVGHGFGGVVGVVVVGGELDVLVEPMIEVVVGATGCGGSVPSEGVA